MPFTAHIKITPARPGGRWEHVRAMQRIAQMVYDGLEDHAALNIGIPGGGQQRSYIGAAGSLGWGQNGVAVKPQMGNYPAHLTVVGFADVGGENESPHEAHEIISGGEEHSIKTNAPWIANPTSSTLTSVGNLKTTIETVLSTSLPNDVTFSVWRIEFAGIVWGDRGISFP